MRIVTVIPAFNEAAVIRDTVAEVRALGLPAVVVDDGSTDATAREAAGARVLRHTINRGQGAALRTGIRYALERGADVVVTFDADGQFDAGEIDRICRPVVSGEADVALGSRFLEPGSVPPLRRLVLRAATWFTRALTGMPVTDAHNGFRALSREAAARIRIRQDGMAHASEIVHEIARLRLRWTEVPVTVRYTEYSRGKGQRATAAFRILFDLLLR